MEHWADYLLFVVFLAISLGIGLFFSLTGGRQKTNEEFLMADRSLKVLPTTISLFVSFQSAIMILGLTAEMYVGGTNFWLQSQISFLMALILVGIFVVPWLFQMKLTSIFQILELRFGVKYVRIYASILGILSQVTYMGTAMLAPSLALQTATGFPAKASIPIMAVVCVIYTTLGGMKAVIWTDVFQGATMVVGMLTILIKGLMVVGGFGNAFSSLSQEGRVIFFTLSPDPTVRHTLWEFLVGYTCLWGFYYGLNQASTQRICAVGSTKDARMTVLLNCPILLVMTGLSQLIGVVVVAYYSRLGCDPLASGIIKNTNQLLPLFVKDDLRSAPGFSGLFLATLYSGALSSVSSSLSGAAANTWDDILKVKYGKLSENRIVWITKGIVVTYGVIAVGFSFIINEMSGPITQVSMAVGGSIAGPLMGLLLASAMERLSWCEAEGALVGGIVGLAFNIWLTVGSVFVKAPSQSLPPLAVTNCTQQAFTNSTATHVIPPVTGFDKLYTVSYLWKTFLGCVFTVVTCVLISAIIKCLNKRTTTHEIPEKVFLHLPWNTKFKKCEVKCEPSSRDTTL